MLEGLRYGVHKSEDTTIKDIYCVYPSSSKITISPKDTIYYNFNSNLLKYHHRKIIISDTNVRKEYLHLDESLGFTRHMIDHSLLYDLSKLAIGLEVIEDNGVVKIIFYKENLILVLENKELSLFITQYLRLCIVQS